MKCLINKEGNEEKRLTKTICQSNFSKFGCQDRHVVLKTPNKIKMSYLKLYKKLKNTIKTLYIYDSSFCFCVKHAV